MIDILCAQIHTSFTAMDERIECLVVKPANSLQTSLLLAIAACFAVVSMVQLATRHFIELPELFAQEYENDVNAVDQVRRTFAMELDRKRALALDNGHWLEAYEFIQLDPSGKQFAEFAAREYTHTESMHQVPRVSGYTYFSSDGARFFESNFDLNTQTAGISLPLPVSALLPMNDDAYAATKGGFIDTLIGPILFVITGITDDQATIKPRGHLVVWRKLDDLFLNELIGPLGIDFDHSPIETQEELVAAIQANPNGVLPRDESGYSHWLINDIEGTPLMVVKQATPVRSFNDGIISASSIVGISASALLLLLVSFQLSRRVVQPILKLRGFLEEVDASEDFSRRFDSQRKDEIGIVARRFDQLLELVERQEAKLKTQNAELEQLAEHDSLTGLYNRRAFDRTLQQGWSVAARAQHPIACIMIDVDCFKSYNDHYGHQAGDKALQAVAGALAATVKRQTDSLCRFGGEEFVMLLVNTDLDSASRIAETMIRSIENLSLPHESSECESIVTASAGVAATIPAKDESPETLIAAADKALYGAKRSGRNRVSTQA